MNWMRDYYIGEGIRDAEAIQAKLEQGKLVPGVYLVTLSHNPHNILEILPAVVLFQKKAARMCPQIVGMARGEEEAVELVRRIVDSVYQETGDVQIEDYIKNR